MWGQSPRRTSKARWCSEEREPHAAGKNAGGSRTSIRPVLQTLASFGGAGVALCRSQTPSFAQKPDFTVLSHRDKTGAVASRAGAWIETCRRRPTPYSHRAWPPFGQKGAIWLLRADSGPARRIGGRAPGRTGGLNGGLGRAFSKGARIVPPGRHRSGGGRWGGMLQFCVLRATVWAKCVLFSEPELYSPDRPTAQSPAVMGRAMAVGLIVSFSGQEGKRQVTLHIPVQSGADAFASRARD